MRLPASRTCSRRRWPRSSWPAWLQPSATRSRRLKRVLAHPRRPGGVPGQPRSSTRRSVRCCSRIRPCEVDRVLRIPGERGVWRRRRRRRCANTSASSSAIVRLDLVDREHRAGAAVRAAAIVTSSFRTCPWSLPPRRCQRRCSRARSPGVTGLVARTLAGRNARTGAEDPSSDKTSSRDRVCAGGRRLPGARAQPRWRAFLEACAGHLQQ